MITAAVRPSLVALVPRRQGDEVEAAVGRVDAAQQAEADDGVVGLHAGRLLEDRLDLLADRVGALQRRGVGQLHVHVEVALVLVRAGSSSGRREPNKPASTAKPSEQEHRQPGLADQVVAAS